jgi:hypothetical protein
MAQPHNDQASFDEDFLDYIPDELIEQPDDSFNRLSNFVAATEASLRSSTALPREGLTIGGSAVASSSRTVAGSSNSIADTSSSICGVAEVQVINGNEQNERLDASIEIAEEAWTTGN